MSGHRIPVQAERVCVYDGRVIVYAVNAEWYKAADTGRCGRRCRDAHALLLFVLVVWSIRELRHDCSIKFFGKELTSRTRLTGGLFRLLLSLAEEMETSRGVFPDTIVALAKAAGGMQMNVLLLNFYKKKKRKW